MRTIAAAIRHARQQEVVSTLRIFGARSARSAIPRSRLVGFEASTLAELRARGILVPVGADRVYLCETALAASLARRRQPPAWTSLVLATAAIAAFGVLLYRAFG